MSADIPPARRFKRGDRVYVQAQQLWLILTAQVMQWPHLRPALITYGELALKMGYADARAGHNLGRQLGIVGHYCLRNRLPALNSIVVDRGTDAPGDGVVHHDERSVTQEQRAVMREDWFRVRVPTTGTFRKVWESMKGDGDE